MNSDTTLGVNLPSNDLDTTLGVNLPSNDLDTTRGVNLPSNDLDATRGVNLPSNDLDATRGVILPSNDLDTTREVASTPSPTAESEQLPTAVESSADVRFAWHDACMTTCTRICSVCNAHAHPMGVSGQRGR